VFYEQLYIVKLFSPVCYVDYLLSVTIHI